MVLFFLTKIEHNGVFGEIWMAWMWITEFPTFCYPFKCVCIKNIDCIYVRVVRRFH